VPVYALWAAIVVIVFPPVFAYIWRESQHRSVAVVLAAAQALHQPRASFTRACL